MPPRRRRDGSGMQGFLPLRRRPSLTHAVTCWYCDFKTNVLNERLHSVGRRHSKFLQIWFTIGIGFGILAMVGVILILIWESSWLVASHERNSLMGKSKKSLYAATPVVPGISVPLRDIGYMSIGTLLSVGAHEFGHALAAASEGVHIEYIAVFLALLFPGAFVAFDYDTLQLLSSLRVLRIYCAGIWHNAVCCAVCWLTLASLPTLLYCMYKHGENPVVLYVPPVSSLAGYLSPADIILEVDGIHVHNPEDWVQKLNLMHLQMLQKQYLVDDSHATNRDVTIRRINTSNAERGFCVANHWLLESKRIEEINHTLSCLEDHIPFGEIPCSSHINIDAEGNTNFTKTSGHRSFCLRAKDVVRLSKCGDGWSNSQMTGICPCSENELCMDPVLSLGSMLIDITYTKADDPECKLRHMQGNNRNLSTGSEIQENNMTSACQFTLLFVGPAASLAYSVQLTGYKPRRLNLFNISSPVWLPNMLEKLLVYSFHVSAALALLNSAPVFYLDGECILETIISLLIPLHSRQKRRVLCLFLTCGTMLLLLGILAGFRMLLL